MNKNSDKYLTLIFLAIGFIFARSSFEKVEAGKFVGALGGILKKFASNNPYPWVKDFLNNVAIPNSVIFGNLTMWGEVLVGISVVFSALYLLLNSKGSKFAYLSLSLGLLGGMFLNAVFWLSSGWTSASTESVNLIMFLVELVGFIYATQQLANTKS